MNGFKVVKWFFEFDPEITKTESSKRQHQDENPAIKLNSLASFFPIPSKK
jgi:hypothetical protein